MIKKIHIIMLGGRPTFSNIEMENMRSWKRCYPDFEIKIWKDEDCIDWINESSFASYHYHTTRVMAYVSDYLRNRILYEEGGLYLDIDVYAMNRIPDSYFEKSFTAWDVWGGKETNNGTCFYAAEPKLPIFKEFCEVLKDSDVNVPTINGAAAAMLRIDKVLRNRGLNAEIENCAETDQDLGDFMVLNRSQFGARHRDCDGYLTHGKTVYMVHACSGSWVVPSYSRFINLKYAIVDENTDIKKIEERLEKIADKDDPALVIVLLLAIEFSPSQHLLDIIEPMKDFFRTYVIPCEKGKRGLALDYITHRIADIKSCRDFMREDYCG